MSVEAGFRDDDSNPRHFGKYRRVKLEVVGCSPAWPNPGGAQSGYLVEGAGRLLLDCGPGVLARLREREQRRDGGPPWHDEQGPWPRVEAIAITHFHLDHWGDLVPWVWGAMLGPGRDLDAVELWLPPGGGELLADLGKSLGRREMFERTFAIREYAEGEEFTAAGFRVLPLRVLHYELVAFGFRVTDPRTESVLAYSGDSGPSGQLLELARNADVFLCEATLLRPNPEGGTRGHLSEQEAQEAFDASGAKRLLLTHRPVERPLAADLEQVHDGFELEL